MGKKIVILGTGGTIAGTAASASDHIGYMAAQVGVEQLVAAVPELGALDLVTEQIAQLDSKDMSHEVWKLLATRVAHWLGQEDVQGVVVTHGTDTLEETAYFLQETLQPSKPVVLTCAMRPSTALAPDGPQNILDATIVARVCGAQGVVVVCAGEVHAAASVQKVHTYRLDAFTSSEEGPLGHVGPGGYRATRAWPETATARDAALKQDVSSWPRVEIVMNHANASGRIVDLMASDGVTGIVAAGTGNGTLGTELETALRRAMEAGVQVLRATRCVLGRVYPMDPPALPDAGALTPAKARVELMLRLIEPAQPVRAK